MKQSFFYILLFISVVQADSTKVVCQYPEILLTTEEKDFPGGGGYWSNGVYVSHPDSKFRSQFFSVGNSVTNERVDHFAVNLRPYVKPVPQATRILNGYLTCRILTPTLIVAGITTMIVSIANQTGSNRKDANGNLPPPDLTGVLIGVVVSISAWIPRTIEKGLVQRGVDEYNARRCVPQ